MDQYTQFLNESANNLRKLENMFQEFLRTGSEQLNESLTQFFNINGMYSINNVPKINENYSDQIQNFNVNIWHEYMQKYIESMIYIVSNSQMEALGIQTISKLKEFFENNWSILELNVLIKYYGFFWEKLIVKNANYPEQKDIIKILIAEIIEEIQDAGEQNSKSKIVKNSQNLKNHIIIPLYKTYVLKDLFNDMQNIGIQQLKLNLKITSTLLGIEYKYCKLINIEL
ncbi:hypothetical protein PPERSA_06321 [Pseudocohnilembus persalinus]|uniref:Uncharacterized protein n=1 Tax=Pseudocohnilembus persalinus TaxID=266149 RepID=A0A0V0QIR6_PSEPJ|nr:hypothetical protein PPERSA_06321 [Pseudocohnilembus persalinus]|eukprot:KRX02126.1 hypothetical protein PPERSA_06321 [Pseudocohnilembus persalinus]